MSAFDISDITFAGAYSNAVTAAKDSDHQNAHRHVERSENRMVTGFLAALVRGIAAVITENRPASRPV